MNKDFVEVANDSGTSGNERSTILTVSGGGY